MPKRGRRHRVRPQRTWERISETTTGFFLSGLKGSFLFFLDCSSSFHSSASKSKCELISSDHRRRSSTHLIYIQNSKGTRHRGSLFSLLYIYLFHYMCCVCAHACTSQHTWESEGDCESGFSFHHRVLGIKPRRPAFGASPFPR